ncbi:hypothetical protein N657DRAFT_505360 [Parathielavia appendiculata]|uniref:Uncharacterized protein n=1 Tax=Parathielavia appendiculata TaxID=2587402 RepID=A0AAN6TXP7_9PEZI|nr:hypothetical protein N657DRAFT_505360 [Parathielavia appendiculata]
MQHCNTLSGIAARRSRPAIQEFPHPSKNATRCCTCPHIIQQTNHVAEHEIGDTVGFCQLLPVDGIPNDPRAHSWASHSFTTALTPGMGAGGAFGRRACCGRERCADCSTPCSPRPGLRYQLGRTKDQRADVTDDASLEHETTTMHGNPTHLLTASCRDFNPRDSIRHLPPLNRDYRT